MPASASRTAPARVNGPDAAEEPRPPLALPKLSVCHFHQFDELKRAYFLRDMFGGL